jgi:hypothetical protein
MLGLPTVAYQGIPKLAWLNALNICTAICIRSFSVRLNHFLDRQIFVHISGCPQIGKVARSIAEAV